MCLPAKNDQSGTSAPGARSIAGLGALMLLACLAGPTLAGAVGALGAGALAGAGGAVLARAVCAVVPAIAVVVRRRQSDAGHGS